MSAIETKNGGSENMDKWYIYICPECDYRIISLDKIKHSVHCPSFECRKTMTPKLVITAYPGTNCEVTLDVRIGKMSEIAPNDKNYDPEFTYGFDIKTDRNGIIGGMSHHGFKDRHKAQATAMLRAVSYGNGGFPLENMLR
jgi:hypothetical protein